MPMDSHLLLVDGSSYIFRAFYAVKADLTNSEGLPTNAVMGFKNMLNNLIKDQKPTHIAMIFDSPGDTFRNEIYPLYKANRGAPPEDLKLQFDPIFELVDCLCVKTLRLDWYEADDIIGTLTKKFENQIKITIISGDKDLTQLVTDSVFMLDTMKRFLFTPKEVKEKFGVAPEKIPEYLALVGDSSDNIPGAKGVGPKTAQNLFSEYKSIEGIYQNAESLKGKLKEKIIDSKEMVDLSLRLTKIKTDLDLSVELDDFLVKPPDYDKLEEFYVRMSFRKDDLLKTQASGLTDENSLQENLSKVLDYDRYELVLEEERLRELVGIFIKQREIAMDFETTSLNVLDAEIVGISFAWGSGNPVYIPFCHQSDHKQIDLLQALSILRPVFENKDLAIIGQNIKYEILVLKNYGIELKCPIFDSMLESYLLDADLNRHGLDELAQRHLGHHNITYEEVTGKGKSQIPFAKVPLDIALKYAAEDSEVTFMLHQKLYPNLIEQNLEGLYLDMELPLLKILAEMESHGIKINKDYLNELKEKHQQEIVIISEEIYGLAGEEFNLNSTQQLSRILFEKLEITKGIKKTKTGFSTDQKTLKKLAFEVPIAKLMLNYRSKTKLINTYLEVLPQLIHPRTNRVHTSFMQSRTATGRLSSVNPNLQNIPIKGLDGSNIRKGFVSEEGYRLVSADYSQIELRILAHLCDDEALIEVFENGLDIHTQTAAAVFGVDETEVTSDQRRASKAINFGIIYGMGAYSLAGEIGVNNKTAQEFIEAYYRKYPSIKPFQNKTIEFCREKGYVETLFQRKRKIPGIDSKNHMIKTGAERIAINTPIQGSAADLIKMAMLKAQDWIKNSGTDAKMILQVHDELVFEVEESQATAFSVQIKQVMERACELKVPLVVDIGNGTNWLEAH